MKTEKIILSKKIYINHEGGQQQPVALTIISDRTVNYLTGFDEDRQYQYLDY
jgi:hypothetical protein